EGDDDDLGVVAALVPFLTQTDEEQVVDDRCAARISAEQALAGPVPGPIVPNDGAVGRVAHDPGVAREPRAVRLEQAGDLGAARQPPQDALTARVRPPPLVGT